MGKFYRSPMLIVNVALTNWRALYKLGYTAASWRGGFGFSYNLSPPMQVGNYAPAFDPDAPAVLTYYVPLYKVGLPVEAQGPVVRAEMLSTPYREYERIVRAQLTEMLSSQGFDARADIAGSSSTGGGRTSTVPGILFRPRREACAARHREESLRSHRLRAFRAARASVLERWRGRGPTCGRTGAGA